MRKRWMMAAACLTAVSMIMSGCGGSTASQPAQPAPTEAAPAETGAAEPASAAEESKAEETAAEETTAAKQGAGAALPEITRQGFLPAEDEAAPEVKAEIQDYTVDADLGNVSNIGDYYFEDDAKKMLAENGFFVSQYGSYEFWEPYESNRYAIMPNFVTVDSMMHTYHLYFSMLQKQTEKNFLAERLKKLSAAMLEKSEAQVRRWRGPSGKMPQSGMWHSSPWARGFWTRRQRRLRRSRMSSKRSSRGSKPTVRSLNPDSPETTKITPSTSSAATTRAMNSWNPISAP